MAMLMLDHQQHKSLLFLNLFSNLRPAHGTGVAACHLRNNAFFGTLAQRPQGEQLQGAALRSRLDYRHRTNGARQIGRNSEMNMRLSLTQRSLSFQTPPARL